MNIKKQIKWGIIGAGNIASKMADAIYKVPGNSLYAIASKSVERATDFARKHEVNKILTYDEIVKCQEIDIIYVATTHNYHFDNAKLALENGKNVLVEKAFTVNAKEAEELVDIARRNGLFLMEAMWTRYLPSIKKMKEIIKSGQIGEVKAFDITFGGFVSPKYELRLKDPKLAGGVTLDMGIYPISLVCYLIDELPSEIKSMTKFSDLGVDEIANYMFKFPSECLANISTSYNLKMRNTALIYGSLGYIEFPNFQSGEQFELFKHNGTNEVVDTQKFFEKNHENGFVYQVQDVYDSLTNGRLESDLIPLDETVGIMKVMDNMREEWNFKYPFE